MATEIKRTAERLSEGKPTRQIEILGDCAIKSDGFKKGEVLELYADLAIACVHQRLAKFVDEPAALKSAGKVAGKSATS